MKAFAARQQRLAAPDDAGELALRQIHLIFNQLHHRLAGGKVVDGIEAVEPEDVRNFFRLLQQRVVIREDAFKHVQQHHVVPRQKRFGARFDIEPAPAAGAQQPQLQKIAAQRHIFLPASGNCRPRARKPDFRLVELSLHEARLRVHDQLRAEPVPVRDAVIVRHALVHLARLFLKLAGRAIIHHKNRRRPERPARARLNGDGRARHLAAGAAVKLTHFRDVVIHEKAHDEVALAK